MTMLKKVVLKSKFISKFLLYKYIDMNDFRSNKYVSGARDFLNSNSLVAKFAFLVLVILVFVFLLRAGTALLTWALSPSENPVLIDGMVDAKHMLVFPQDPSVKGAKPIMRSTNQRTGMEFTWSTWIFIDDFTYKQGQYKHIFHKGNDGIQVDPGTDTAGCSASPSGGLNSPNNAPGLYILPNQNSLLVIISTFDNPSNKILVEDIPLNKWINVILRLENNIFDVYINGSIVRRHVLDNDKTGDVFFQNYGDVYALMNGGFSGYMSDLKYFDYAAPINKIQSIVNKGPNMNMKSNDMKESEPHYLSTRWYFAGNEDAYNP